MSTYAIGDVQGCYEELQDLLNEINFDQGNDKLWFVGDLVNRGPDSLAVLRLVISLDTISVIGNHEYHLLAIDAGIKDAGKKDTLDDILKAEDRQQLIAWIKQLPLIHYDSSNGFCMLHAGIPPQWGLTKALKLQFIARLFIMQQMKENMTISLK